MATTRPMKIRYIGENLYTQDISGEITKYDRENEELLFNTLLKERLRSADGRHPDGIDYNDIVWDNFTICLETVAETPEYRTSRSMELLAHKYFSNSIFTMQQYPEDGLIEIATPEDAAAHIEAITTDDFFICHNALQVVYAMELHHLRTINKGGHGETFRKCEVCGRYFITQNEMYCSDNCKKKAQRDQTEQANKDIKNIYRKRITDRFRQQIKRLETAGNTSTIDKVKEERDTFKKERKQQYRRFKTGEITEQEYIDWLIQKYEEGKEK